MKSLYLQVLLAIVLGAAVGHFYPHTGEALQPLGTAFIKLVKMVIAPVIFLTIVTGVASLKHLQQLGRVALKALAYFLVLSTLALLVGMLVGNFLQPGAGMHVDPATLDKQAVAGYATAAHDQSITAFLLNIIPTTLVGAFTGGEILPVLFVSILFGIALALTGERGAPVLRALQLVSEVFFKFVAILMKAAPIGAFGAFAFTIGRYGIGSVADLAALVGTFYLTSVLFVLVVLGAVLALVGGNILRLCAYLKEELFLVFGTSSSESALPSLISKLERAGCPATVVGLVVPAGYSFNLDGTNIYMTLAALFIAQATGVHLSLGEQFSLFAVAMISSKGAAGVTGAGFITLAATLAIVPSVPVAGMTLILCVDRFMSECRALTNFMGNAVATIVVSRWEGGLDRARLRQIGDGA
jgi:aerobic C4-dicarboxylate transport protein